ncbi:hypothetical protein F4678DRAFT_335490 [Xylaria arbuscula]|nr:hypothetical protein F4678DRAFT_335490 [Xylaria arbuscula]
MAASALPASLSSLTEREAIIDTMYRAVQAFDLGDSELIKSAIDDNIVFALPGRPPAEGFSVFKAAMFDHIAFNLDTTHHLTNFRVSVESGASTAKIQCYTIAQHFRKGEGHKPGSEKFTAGGMYFCDVVKDEGSGFWKIKDWKLNVIWTEGDHALMIAP